MTSAAFVIRVKKDIVFSFQVMEFCNYLKNGMQYNGARASPGLQHYGRMAGCMRRKDREIIEREEIMDVIDRCKVCHLAMAENNRPYVVPMNFGYEMTEDRLTLYIHSASEGKKLDILRKNGYVCFEMCEESGMIYDSRNPCSSGCYYASVTGNGMAEFVTEPEEKARALSLLMRHMVNEDITFTGQQSAPVCIIKITAENLTGKRRTRPQA